MNKAEVDSIVTRVLSGEIDAYEEIVLACQHDAWKVVTAMLLDKQKTEDLVQQTFITAFKHLHRFERGRDFNIWLKEIARNEVRQEIRRADREHCRLNVYYSDLIQTCDQPSGATNEERLEEALTASSAESVGRWRQG